MVPLIGVVPAPKETLIRLSISTESSIHVVDKGSQTTNETIVTINENSPTVQHAQKNTNTQTATNNDQDMITTEKIF